VLDDFGGVAFALSLSALDLVGFDKVASLNLLFSTLKIIFAIFLLNIQQKTILTSIGDAV
jgi:hypothetical protein